MSVLVCVVVCLCVVFNEIIEVGVIIRMVSHDCQNTKDDVA